MLTLFSIKEMQDEIYKKANRQNGSRTIGSAE